MDAAPPPEDDQEIEKLHLFVDEAGDPTLFHSSGKPILETPGCTRFFIMGKLEADDPVALGAALDALRGELLADPYFAGVESFRPERRKTALHFHAKDDVPEVRYRVFSLLRALGGAVRFHAVVCDKKRILAEEEARRRAEPGHRYQPDGVYDGLIRSLFSKLHRLADRYELVIAERGNRKRTHALEAALKHAERDFEGKFGFRREGEWNLKVGNPRRDVGLQAVDYFLWAVQRFYECRLEPGTGAKKLNDKTGLEFREDRFLNLLWPQIAEIHDLDFGPSGGTFYGPKKPLTLEERFGGKARK